MLKAVLFDMDGVIVDTEPLHRKAYFKMFSDVNITVNEELYASFTGQSTINICKRLVNYFNKKVQYRLFKCVYINVGMIFQA